MLTENTITKLREMRLGTMADAFNAQLTAPNIAELSFQYLQNGFRSFLLTPRKIKYRYNILTPKIYL